MSKIIPLCIVVLLLSTSSGFAFLYTNSIWFQESLDKENSKFYFISSDYAKWARKREFDSRSIIYSYSFKDQSVTKFYQADRPVSQIRYLPKSGLISFVTLRSLHLVNESGVKVGGFTDNSEEGFIPEYVWNHDRTQVAYLLAKSDPEEGKPGPPYTSLGVWLYDFKTEKKKKIADLGRYLETDLERKCLFFRTADAAYRYEFATEKLELYPEMKLKGLDFFECSNDRRYCAYGIGILGVDSEYESTISFFDNKIGKQMTPDNLDFLKGINATTIIWGKSSKYMAFKADRERGAKKSSIYIFNFEQKKLVEKIDIKARLVGISPDRSTLCIYDRNKDIFFMKEFPKE